MIYLNPLDQPICKQCNLALFKVAGTKVGYICGKCGTQYSKAKPPKLKPEAPYNCIFCGSPSWIAPEDQEAPPDYCHESDHGSREEWLEEHEEELE